MANKSAVLHIRIDDRLKALLQNEADRTGGGEISALAREILIAAVLHPRLSAPGVRLLNHLSQFAADIEMRTGRELLSDPYTFAMFEAGIKWLFAREAPRGRVKVPERVRDMQRLPKGSKTIWSDPGASGAMIAQSVFLRDEPPGGVIDVSMSEVERNRAAHRVRGSRPPRKGKEVK
jgi:hypothetical protein